MCCTVTKYLTLYLPARHSTTFVSYVSASRFSWRFGSSLFESRRSAKQGCGWWIPVRLKMFISEAFKGEIRPLSLPMVNLADAT